MAEAEKIIENIDGSEFDLAEVPKLHVVADEQEQDEFAGRSDYYVINNNKDYGVFFSDTKDIVGNRYRIQINQPLKQFDTKFSKAYRATDSKGKNPDIYATVLDRDFPIRLAEINKLHRKKQEGFANVLAFSRIPTSLGQGKYMVVILEEPKGITLSEFIKKTGPLSETVIFDQIVPVLSGVLGFLESNKVTHGHIHPDRIYVSEAGVITVGECVSEICGYSQEVFYEPLDRATVLPIGKGSGSTAVDYYALGVLVGFLVRGKNHVAHISDENIIELKFTDGTYRMVTHGLDLNPHMLDLLRGTINEMADIWNSKSLVEWIKGRRFNLLPPASNKQASRPISFMGAKYMNTKHLAYAFSKHWEEAKEFIKNDTLVRWVERSIQNTDLAYRIENASSLVNVESDTELSREDEHLCQIIMLLDPKGAIRVKGGFACHIDAIGAMMAYAKKIEHDEYVTIVSNLIIHDLISFWNTREGGKTLLSQAAQDVVFSLQISRDLIKRRESGFGITRCLYELNPTLTCQSALMVDDCVFSVDEFLKKLNEDDNIKGEMLDDHMWCFLSNRLTLPRAIRISLLSRFPAYENNVYVQALAILSHAQSVTKIEVLDKLTKKIRESLNVVIGTFHSKTIRSDLQEKIDKVYLSGNITLLLKVMTDHKYIVRDTLGFLKARKRYKSNALQIILLSNRAAIHNVGYRYGLQFAVMLSFLVASIVVVTLIIKFL